MTHNTDCTVKDAYRSRITKAAEDLYLHGNWKPLRELADEKGWEHIGTGGARAVYQVSDGGSTVDDATHQSPCVIKFATQGSRVWNGQTQNRKEIHNYQSVPDELVNPVEGPPVFVPLKDWHSQWLWISLPKVNQKGGSVVDVKKRLGEHGWTCNDMSLDNVGEMHGVSVILDYGLDCTEHNASEMVDELVFNLERKTAQSITGGVSDAVGGGDKWFEVEFLPPGYVHGHRPPDDPSRMTGISTAIQERSGVQLFELVFGAWEPGRLGSDPDLWVERTAREWNDKWRSFKLEAAYIDEAENGDLQAVIEARAGHHPHSPEIAADAYSDLLQIFEERWPGPGDEEPTRPMVSSD